MKTIFNESLTVSNENITACITKLDKLLLPFESKNHLEIRRGLLTLEEELLRFQNSFGADANVCCLLHRLLWLSEDHRKGCGAKQFKT